MNVLPDRLSYSLFTITFTKARHFTNERHLDIRSRTSITFLMLIAIHVETKRHLSSLLVLWAAINRHQAKRDSNERLKFGDILYILEMYAETARNNLQTYSSQFRLCSTDISNLHPLLKEKSTAVVKYTPDTVCPHRAWQRARQFEKSKIYYMFAMNVTKKAQTK